MRPRACASFDTDWVPGEYLTDYYGEVEPDERATIAYFVDGDAPDRPGRPVLLFGVGPTLHHVFLAAGTASELHLADYLAATSPSRALDRPRAWRPRLAPVRALHARVRGRRRPDGGPDHAARGAHAHEDHPTDPGRRAPAQAEWRIATPPSSAPIAPDSATDERATWRTFMEHISGRVEPGGVFITSALRRCRSYIVGGKRFPSANVDEHDLHAVLEPSFEGRIDRGPRAGRT